MLVVGGEDVTDREWDKALHIQTGGRENESGGRYMPYEPTPYSVLERLAESGWVGKDGRLLDYGCGKGRAAIFLALKTGCHAVGIDHSAKLISMAEENRLKSSVADRVRFEQARAESYEPGAENLFFFFNPFSGDVLRAVLRRIRRGRSQRGGARLLFYYPTDGFLSCLGEEEWLREAGRIDCRDLFPGNNSQEIIRIFDTDFH